MFKKIVFVFVIAVNLLSTDLQINNFVKGVDISVDCDTIIERKSYLLCYSYSRRIPRLVTYQITKQEIENRTNLKRVSFRVDRNIPSQYRVLPSDYSHSGYDRGHTVPNSMFNYDKDVIKEVFKMSIIAPQDRHFNRVVWRKLEKHIEDMAVKYNKVNVIVGLCGELGKIKDISIPKYWVMFVEFNKTYEEYIYLNIKRTHNLSGKVKVENVCPNLFK